MTSFVELMGGRPPDPVKSETRGPARVSEDAHQDDVNARANFSMIAAQRSSQAQSIEKGNTACADFGEQDADGNPKRTNIIEESDGIGNQHFDASTARVLWIETNKESHKNRSTPYRTISLKEVIAELGAPACKPKGEGPSVIWSTYVAHDARRREAQEERGQYVALVIDVDKGGPSYGEVQTVIRALFPRAMAVIYSTAGASVQLPKWRVIVPLAAPLEGKLFEDIQDAAFRALGKLGMQCDERMSTPSQICYLPNIPPDARDANGVPLFYVNGVLPGDPLELDDHPIAIDAMRVREKREELIRQSKERKERKRLELERKIREGAATEGDRLIDVFNRSTSVEDALKAYGYTQKHGGSPDWKSKFQQSGSYATRVYDNRWHSLSGSDAREGVGERAVSGGRFGDAYDLYVHYTHHGDHSAAWREIGERIRNSLGDDFNPEQAFTGVFQDLTPAGSPEASADGGWDYIDLFSTTPAPTIKDRMLPDIIAKWSSDQTLLLRAPREFLVFCAISCCAAAIHDGIRIRVKRHGSYLQSARLWINLIGDVSASKSPALKAAKVPLEAISKRLAERKARAWAIYEQALEQHKADKRAAEKAKQPLPWPPEKPSVPGLLTNDINIEALGELLRDTPGGVLCIRDELSGWLRALEGYDKSGKDRPQYLEAYDGGFKSIHRIGRGTINVPNWGMSLLGGIQPSVMADLFQKMDMGDDGLMQRFIPVMARPASVEEDRPADQTALHAYHALVEGLYDIRPPEGSDGEDMAVEQSEEAHAVREDLEADVQALADVACDKPLKGFYGKVRGMYGRMLLTFHCIEVLGKAHPSNVHVSVETAKRVDALFRGFILPSAELFYSEMLGANTRFENARRLAEDLLAHDGEQVTKRHLQRYSTPWRNADDAQRAEMMHVLETYGWVRPIGRGRGKHDLPMAWQINPAVIADQAARRQRVLERKARDRALLVALAEKARADGGEV